MSRLKKALKKISAPLEKVANVGTLGLTNFGGAANNPIRNAANGPSAGPQPQAPSQAGDQSSIDQFMTDTQNRYTMQQQQLQTLLDKYRTNAETSLTSGPEGEALRQKYNSMGILNSGAFNDALAQKFSDLQKNSDMSLMQQGLNTTDTLQNIAEGGLQRKFGVEDEQYQAAMNSYLARIGAKNDRKNALISAGGNIFGSLMGKR